MAYFRSKWIHVLPSFALKRTVMAPAVVLQRRQQTTFVGRACNCKHTIGIHRQCRRLSSQRAETVMNVFDRKTKRMQRNQTALLKDYDVYDYIKEEMGWRMADKINDISRNFPVVVDIGCGRGHIGKHITKENVGILYQCDMAEKVLDQSVVSEEVPTVKVHCDDEFLPFRPNSVDLVVTSMSLHWVNDLPGVFKQIQGTLRPDGCFMGAMFGGETLFELRVALQLAEQEMEGGIAAHVSPFTSVQDLGSLLNRAGYSMLTMDVDEIVVNFPSMRHVMLDIKGMGESNCAWSRKLRLSRPTIKRAEEIYKEMYGKTRDGQDCYPATFHILNFIAWKPDPSQAQPAKRGSGQVSMKDLGKLDQLTKQIDDLKAEVKGSEGLQTSMGHISEQLEKLKKSVEKEDQGSSDDSKR